MLLQMYQTKRKNPKLMMVALLNQLPVLKILLLLKIIDTIKIDIRKRNQKNATNAGEFKAPEGPISDHFTGCTNPIDIFLKYLDTEIIDNILYQSNLYITQKLSRAKPTDRREFIGFLGIKILMGYNKLPSWTHFWSNEPDLSVPFASTVMPRNLFPEILSHLHVNDNLLMSRYNIDRLYKLRPLIESLNNRYLKLYDILKQVLIDESMILFKGRSSLKQYNPMKPIKRGYKLRVGADMDGYISTFDVYQGQNAMPKDYNFPA